MYPNIHNYPVIAFDTETTGLRYPRDRAFALGIASEEGAWGWDFRHDPNALEWLQYELPRYEGRIVAHNLSFDVKMSAAAGLAVPFHNADDTVIRACCINEHENTIFPWTRKRPTGYGLDSLANKYCDMRKDQEFYVIAAKWLGTHYPKKAAYTQGQVMASISLLPWEIVEPYLLQDCVATLVLWDWQEGEIEKQGIRDICEFERAVTPSIIRAEMRGIDISVERTQQAIERMTPIIVEAQSKIDHLAGRQVNVNSPPQIKELFSPYEENGEWYAVDGTPLERTKSGNPSFGGSALRNISMPAAAAIVELRSLIKTRDTFLSGHILGHEVNGKVYPNINQSKGEDAGTGTGRLSYTDPAMQQIPSRNKRVAEIVKPCFLPPSGMIWVEPDLQSFEVRVFAHLVAAYNDGIAKAYAVDPKLDFHTWVGEMTNLPRNATYSGQANAKQLNLSMIFNQGNGQTADTMGMPWTWDSFKSGGEVIRYKKAGTEAMAVIDDYHRRVQGVKILAERAKAVAEARGYIFTSTGRRLRFPKGYKSYKASGLLIQSTSADINKRNWMRIEEALGEDGHLILNTHDAYSMAIYEDRWRQGFNRVKDAIEDVSDIGLRVPLILELDGAGYDWWQAKSGFMK